jgi:thiol-disulfide isomerase/thioredoxin
MSRYCRLAALGAVVLMMADAVGAQIVASPNVSDLFTVRHSPTPVVATTVVDAKSGQPYHLWRFRTEVRNDHPFPVRILRFDFEEVGPDGLPRPDRDGRTFATKEFTEWYTAADPVSDGWLAPGQTAADSSNWNRSGLPVPVPGRWYYVAADSSGREYRAAAPIDLCPYQPAAAPWAGADAERLVPVVLDLAWPGGARPAIMQLRFDRLSYDPQLPPPAVYTWNGVDIPVLTAVAPGLYRLHLYASGFKPVSLPIILAEGGEPLSLSWRARRAGAADPDDEAPVDVDEAHAYLREVWALQEQADRTSAALTEAASAHRAAHDGSMDGFTFDWSTLQRNLMTTMTSAEHVATRRFAAWLAVSMGPVADRTAAALIDSLLPSTSPLWAASPDAALRAAYACGKLIDRDLVTPLATVNPDRLVQAYAVAALASEAREKGDEDTVGRLRTRLDVEFADVRAVDRYRQRLAVEPKVRAGLPAPAFAARDRDTGIEFNRTDFEGRYLLVHFWSTTCGFCKQEMPSVHAVVDKYRDRGLEIVSFSLDEKVENVDAYRQGRWKLPWKQAVLTAGTADPVARAYEVVGIPHLVLIGPDGIIVTTGDALRGEQLDATLARLLVGE